MTNREWLNMLAAEAPDKLTEFFDAEHVDGGAAELEAAYAKNRALREHIRKMQEGRNGWHVKAEKLANQVDELAAQLDLLEQQLVLALAYKVENDALRERNRKMAEQLVDIRAVIEDDLR